MRPARPASAGEPAPAVRPAHRAVLLPSLPAGTMALDVLYAPRRVGRAVCVIRDHCGRMLPVAPAGPLSAVAARGRESPRLGQTHPRLRSVPTGAQRDRPEHCHLASHLDQKAGDWARSARTRQRAGSIRAMDRSSHGRRGVVQRTIHAGHRGGRLRGRRGHRRGAMGAAMRRNQCHAGARRSARGGSLGRRRRAHGWCDRCRWAAPGRACGAIRTGDTVEATRPAPTCCRGPRRSQCNGTRKVPTGQGANHQDAARVRPVRTQAGRRRHAGHQCLDRWKQGGAGRA